MEANYLVIGEFANAENARAAISELKDRGHDKDLRYFSPFPEHHLEDALYQGRKRSPVRRFTLLGAVTGCLGAFLMCSWMSIDYPLRVSAKPLVSIPAFVIIGFECTILIGSIVTLLAMFFFSGIPSIFQSAGFRPEFTEGTFGVVVKVPKEKSESLKSDMESWGAGKVEIEYRR
jgi:hypothetical protein